MHARQKVRDDQFVSKEGILCQVFTSTNKKTNNPDVRHLDISKERGHILYTVIGDKQHPTVTSESVQARFNIYICVFVHKIVHIVPVYSYIVRVENKQKITWKIKRTFLSFLQEVRLHSLSVDLISELFTI